MKFADNLRQLRKEKDISQEALAVDLKVSRQTISKWENGSAMPDLKKLTEIAEHFNTTMDSLLGLSDDACEKGNEDGFDYKNYINSMLTFLEDNEKMRYNRIFKRFVTILVVLVIAFSITVCSLVSSFNNQIGNLLSRIDSLQYASSINNSSADYDDSKDTAASYKIIEINKDKPYMFKVEFTYEPEVYPKNADIYFLIPQRNGEAEKVNAENNNGTFSLTADIDIMAKGKYYVCIDDGSKITKESINLNIFFEVFSTSTSTIENSVKWDQQGNVTGINIGYDEEGATMSYDIDFKVLSGIKIKKAQLIAEVNGKEALNRELQINNPSDSYYTGQVMLDPFRVDLIDKPVNTFCFYISFITDNGLELRYYPAPFDIPEVEIMKSGCYEAIIDDASVMYDEDVMYNN